MPYSDGSEIFTDGQWPINGLTNSKVFKGRSPYIWLVLDYLLGSPKMKTDDTAWEEKSCHCTVFLEKK